MEPRLIPWCLAATGFLAALSVFGLHGQLDAPGQRVQPRVAVAQGLAPPTADHQVFGSLQVPAAEEPEQATQTLILPLPPASRPGPDVQAVVDDQPTVDDLPSPRSPPESPE